MGSYFLAGMGLLLMLNLFWERRNVHLDKRENWAFLGLWGLAWIVVLCVSEFPQWTTPRQWIDFVYKPLLLWLTHSS